MRRSIKWIEDRREHFTNAAQERDQYWSIDIAVSAEGKVLGLLRRTAAYEWLKHHGLDCAHTISELPLMVPFKVNRDTKVAAMMEDLMHTGATKAIVVDADDKLCGIVTVFDLLKGRR